MSQPLDAADPAHTPAWVRAILDESPERLEPDELMRLAVRIARANVDQGGGPFGAVVATADGRVVDVGWNCVVSTHDSTAHGEIVALRRAQRRLRTHDLAGHVMHSSCEPCIQCFGAIYWSGLDACYAAATREDAEAIGFDEGPVYDALWARARERRGLKHVPRFGRDDQALDPLRAYAARGGPVY